jgi:radical SAM-linked protein
MASRQPDGPPPPPTVQRLRVHYAKRGRLRFSSHRDFQRALERALRRVEAPMAYSAGFSPHPKISYANAAPTGAASEAEYLEIGVARRCDPGSLRRALDDALPGGLDVLDIVEAGSGGLVERLEASWWRIECPGEDPERIRAAVHAFLAAESVQVERLTKQGVRSFDARAAVARLVVAEVDAEVEAADSSLSVSFGRATYTVRSCAILDLVVRHTTPAVRPDDVLAALRVVADFAPASPPLVTRLAQGPLDEVNGTVADPLAPDRNLAAT